MSTPQPKKKKLLGKILKAAALIALTLLARKPGIVGAAAKAGGVVLGENEAE